MCMCLFVCVYKLRQTHTYVYVCVCTGINQCFPVSMITSAITFFFYQNAWETVIAHQKTNKQKKHFQLQTKGKNYTDVNRMKRCRYQNTEEYKSQWAQCPRRPSGEYSHYFQRTVSVTSYHGDE